jgi:DNA-binding beta-propeller fold protein YncE
VRWQLLMVACLAGCGGGPSTALVPPVSSSLALTVDDRALWVVNPESDSVSVIDPIARVLLGSSLRPIGF